MGDNQLTRSVSSLATLPTLREGRARIIGGADRGHSRLLRRSQPCVLGSAPGCDFVLRDAGVSRRHCEVQLGRRGFVVRDLDSRNGTFFEGAQISDAAVPPGAILRLGHTLLVLEVAGEPQHIDPSDQVQFGALRGRGVRMRRVFTLLERAASCDVTVLLCGESGTGKELAAQAIHAHSPRAGAPFGVLDCACVTPTLAQSRLFGHVAGAFTGADGEHAGVFEISQGGTVFLDEIGELPLEIQPNLLRVCEEGTVVRLGSTEPRPVDVRIVAASHRDLASEVEQGHFRRDLFYRLQVFPITLPALRDRLEDLPDIIAALLQQLGVPEGGRPIDGANLAQLMAYDWPGNVRELRNVLERALVSAGEPLPFCRLRLQLEPAVTAAASLPTARRGATFQQEKRDAVDRFERSYLVELMARHDHNLRRASRDSGIERTQLKRLLRKHGLR